MIWHELKRRKVVRVATVYAAVAWALLEIITLVEEPLRLPAWTDTLLIVLLAVGFVLAVALAWAYELTPDGITREQPTAAAAGQPAGPAWVGYAVTALVAALLGAVSYSFATRDTDQDWVERSALPEIEARLAVGDWQGAFASAREVELRLPGTPELAELWPQMSWPTTIESTPAGATVSYQPYDRPDDEWQALGRTPLDSIRFPFGLSRLRLELDGYLTLDRTLGGGFINSDVLPTRSPTSGLEMIVGPERFVLDTSETLPDGKVRVPAWSQSLDGEALSLRDFLLDRYEVTNAQFKEFVDAGGYGRSSLWDPIVQDGVAVPFDDSRALFLDGTGQPGPSTWEAGDYPPGEADHPVSGVSWYEASAYARFVGEELPTAHHWRRARATATLPWLLPVSNFDGAGPRSVRASRAMSYVGTFDMAGNVREWTSTRIDDRNVILGGSWSDPAFVAAEDYTAVPPINRSPGNGFRLALTNDDPQVALRVRAPLRDPGADSPGFSHEPVSDQVFEAWGGQFEYDRGPMEVAVEESVEFRSWVRERITLEAGYGDQRLVLYLYLPKNASPPYRTVVYWPGWDSFSLDSVEQYFGKHADFLPRRGRAVAFPVYPGSFERRDPNLRRPQFSTTGYRDGAIDGVRDLRRTLDYLETRGDIDQRSFAYFGYSWGGLNAPIALTREPRLRSAVIYMAVLREVAPEIDPINALPRIDIPTLVLSGEFDGTAPLEPSRRYYELIGSEVKRHVVVPGGHFVPRDVLISESLAWLDRYQGPPEG